MGLQHVKIIEISTQISRLVQSKHYSIEKAAKIIFATCAFAEFVEGYAEVGTSFQLESGHSIYLKPHRFEKGFHQFTIYPPILHKNTTYEAFTVKLQ